MGSWGWCKFPLRKTVRDVTQHVATHDGWQKWSPRKHNYFACEYGTWSQYQLPKYYCKPTDGSASLESQFWVVLWGVKWSWLYIVLLGKWQNLFSFAALISVDISWRKAALWKQSFHSHYLEDTLEIAPRGLNQKAASLPSLSSLGVRCFAKLLPWFFFPL